VVLGSAWLSRPLNAREMRPSPSSPLGPTSDAPDRERVTLAGAASRDSRASREDHAGAASNSAPQVVPSDLPAWAVAAPAPSRRAGSRARDGVNVPDLEDECADEGVVAGARRPLSKQRGAGARVSRLDPLLRIVDAARILNVSQRTVRRLIASRAIGVVRIRGSVRLRRKEIGMLIARGRTRR
jgi:excisionase family DNA binding protein